VFTDRKQWRPATGDQAVEQLEALTIQVWPKIKYYAVGLRAPRTWIVSLGTFVVSSLLITILLAFLRIVSPSHFTSLFSHSFGVIVLVPFFLFFFTLFLALFMNQWLEVRAYRKALKKHLAPSMNTYYSPEGALGVQEHLATLMGGKYLQEGQERHLLLLGGPGSGKTANLNYAVYRAVRTARQWKNKIPVLIQMKYYNGFLRNLRVTSEEQDSASTPGGEAALADTLLAYLLDGEQEGKLQAGKEPELVGLHHLRFFFRRLVAQGRIVFLCDGMNELENDALTVIHRELMDLMQITQNSVVMTCRELEYQEQDLLKALANYGASIHMLPPLTADDVTAIVRIQLQAQRIPGQIPVGAAGIKEAQEQIRRLSQLYRETSPFMLMMLIEALKSPAAYARTISHGHLLRLSVDQRPLTHEPGALIFGDHPDAQYVKDFLSAVACTARRNGQRNAVQLVKDTKFTTASQLQDFLNIWLSDNEVDVSNFTQENIGKFLRIALDSGIITISNNGVLSFMHELIAEYFAAEYLRLIYHRKDVDDELFWQSVYESEVQAAGLWSEPVAIWAGLEDQPNEIARFLMTNVDYYCRQKGMSVPDADFYHYHAMALSLGCLGVQVSDGLPDETLSYLKRSALVKEKHEQLALIFKRCADEGGIGVYQALLPYIHLPGLLDVLVKIHDLYSETENSTILAMIFEYMEKVAANPAYVEQKQPLITLIGEIGRRGDETARRRSRLLSEVSQPPLLRAAAINVLELIGNPADVALLIGYLHTSDLEVIGPAISAVISFGPGVALDLLEREETKLHDRAHAQTRLNILRVLEAYLEAKPPQLATALVVRFLSAFDQESTWHLAKQLLNRQIQKSPEELSVATTCLLDAIDTQDEIQAEQIQQLLKENCLQVLETITNYWKTQQRRETAWERIVLVLGSVSDTSILGFLLQQVNEPRPSMQQALSTALSLQRESAEPLLWVVLAPATSQQGIQVAGNALRQIGESCLPSICDTLLTIQNHADATEAGLKCLLEVLDEWKKEGRISASAEAATVPAFLALFKWLVEDVHLHSQLGADVIPVMAGFRDQRIVEALVKVLSRPGIMLEKIYEEAIKGLSQYGEFAIDHMIELLNTPKETVLTQRVRQVLLEIEPFPREKLLSAFSNATVAVVQQVKWVFLANQQEAETVRFLAKHLLDSVSDHPLVDNIEHTLTEMRPAHTMPYLIEVLGQPHWQVIKPLLRTCPQPEIVLSLLVADPANVERYVLGLEVLREEFDCVTVLPWLISGLAHDNTREHTSRLIASMARTYDGDLLPDIVRLFNPAIARPEPLPAPLPAVRRTLQELLTTELAENSLPALVLGLADPPLREDCADSLVTLAHTPQRQQEVLQGVLQALHNPTQRLGAHRTLVKCGDLATQPVGDLVRGNEPVLVQEACTILAEMGTTAFPTIYQLAHEPEHQAHADNILHLIPADIISKGMLAYFASDEWEKQAIAFYFLAKSMHDGPSARLGSPNLGSALLAHMLEDTNSDVWQPSLIALLFFAQGRRAEMARQMVSAITETSQVQVPPEFMRALSLLGNDAADRLGLAIHNPGISETLRLQMVGLLGTLAEDEQIAAYALGLAAGAYGTANSHRALGLRALGGLLAGGFYDEKKLEHIREELSASSKAQDRAAREFFDALLGKRRQPNSVRLREIISSQQGDMERLNERIHQQEEELEQARRRSPNVEIHAMSSQ
jgi:hypothetical protein